MQVLVLEVLVPGILHVGFSQPENYVSDQFHMQLSLDKGGADIAECRRCHIDARFITEWNR